MRVIKPQENNGSIRIRFTYKGQRLNLGLTGLKWRDDRDRSKALAIAAQISADLTSDTLDPTLDRYRLRPTVSKKPLRGTIQIWDAWVSTLDLSPFTLAGHYKTTRRAIERGDLFRSDLSAFTYNFRRRCINSAYAWAIANGLAAVNPYAHIKAKRTSRKTIEVFSLTELKAIQHVMASDYPDYYDFTEFLMVSGCRFGEATGLQAKNVHVANSTISIKTTLRLNLHTRKTEIREGTKTDTHRDLKSPQLLNVVLRHGLPEDPDDLVFRAPRGGVIHLTRYRPNIWVPALLKAGVKYRNIHTMRHTALSHALAQPGISVPDVAYLAGHRDSTMVLKTYGHCVDQPQLPGLDVGPD